MISRAMITWLTPSISQSLPTNLNSKICKSLIVLLLMKLIFKILSKKKIWFLRRVSIQVRWSKFSMKKLKKINLSARVKANSYFLVGIFMKVTGARGQEMAMQFLNGKMVTGTKVSLFKINVSPDLLFAFFMFVSRRVSS